MSDTMSKKSPRNERNAESLAKGCRRFVFALISFIALAQIAGGVGGLVWAKRLVAKPLDWQEIAVATVVATLFGSIGFALLSWIALSVRRSLNAPPSDVPRGKPWLARPDWAAGHVEATGGAAMAAPILAAVAIWWWIATAPLLSVLPTLLRGANDRWVWVTILFPIVGGALVGACAYQFLRARKFGRSTFQMASVPGVVGGQLAGVVHIPVAINAPDGYHLRLTCLEEQRRHKETHWETVWQDERLATATLGTETGVATAVPVLFAIPYDVPETSRPSSRRDVQWRLEIWAKLPGVNYRAEFEVPVFKTADSCRDFRLDEDLVEDFSPPPDRERVLREAGIDRLPTADGGVQLAFRAARNPGSALVVSLAVAGFGVGIWFLLHNRAFIVFPILLGLMATVFLYLALDLWLYRSAVHASPHELRVRSGWLGIGPTRTFPAETIRRFSSAEYMSSGKNIWCTIYVVPRKGKKHTLAKGIGSKLIERAVIDELDAALGRG